MPFDHAEKDIKIGFSQEKPTSSNAPARRCRFDDFFTNGMARIFSHHPPPLFFSLAARQVGKHYVCRRLDSLKHYRVVKGHDPKKTRL